MSSAIDLHIHTSASDGVSSPREVVHRAARLGVSTIAITDHDTVSGLDEALREAAGRGVRVIPGVEISSEHDGVPAHILGYSVDCLEPAFARRLAHFTEARLERARTITDRLGELGVRLSWDDVLDEGQDGAIGRPHIARVMVRAGYVESVEEAFCRYLNHGQKAYVPREKVTPSEAIHLIHQAGGLAVLAHPWNVIFLLESLVSEGLDGLEVYYRDYDSCQQGRLGWLAREHGLVATGGSDYHGPAPGAFPLGGVRVPQECVTMLDARHAE